MDSDVVTVTLEAMDSGRPARAEKIATTAEITEKLGQAQAVFVSEYRGLSVKQLADVRNALRPTGAEHVVYKNTLARIAVREAGLDGLEDILVGPTAMTLVSGDIAAAAKALREMSKAHPALIIRGGMLAGVTLSADDVIALADLPSREELLARIAGALQAPLTKTARLLAAIPQRFAGDLLALIDKHIVSPEGLTPEEELVNEFFPWLTGEMWSAASHILQETTRRVDSDNRASLDDLREAGSRLRELVGVAPAVVTTRPSA